MKTNTTTIRIASLVFGIIAVSALVCAIAFKANWHYATAAIAVLMVIVSWDDKLEINPDED